MILTIALLFAGAYFLRRFLLSISETAEDAVPFDIDFPVGVESEPEWKPKTVLEKPSIHALGNPETELTCYDPSTSALLAVLRKTPADQVKIILNDTQKAQQEWSETSFAKRKAVLASLLEFVVTRQREIAQVAARDSGKTLKVVDASFGEIITTCEKASWLLKHGEAVLQPEYRSTGWLTAHKQAIVEYQPLGVVAAIVSWNYPFHNAIGPVLSALFAGNGIIVKCSEHVAWSSSWFERMVHACLRAHGVNTNLVRFLIGEADVGQALIAASPAKLTFIGSPKVGQRVMRQASDYLTPIVLELGGKDAAVICDDVDLDAIVPLILRGTFQNVGQNCIGLERVILQDTIYEKFIEKVEPKIRALRVGPPLQEDVDCGAITMSHHIQHIDNLVQDAIKQGARLVFGGKPFQHPSFPHGQFYTPTLLVDVQPTMTIAQTEVFGPVMTVMKFSTDSEAVSLMNSTPFGLGASVFCRSRTRAEYLMRHTDSGMMNWNDFAVNYLCQSLPFGGVKESGFGRFAGIEGLRGECKMRSVTKDKFGVQTKMPKKMQYPVDEKSVAFCEGLVGTIYAASWSERLNYLKQLVTASF